MSVAFVFTKLQSPLSVYQCSVQMNNVAQFPWRLNLKSNKELQTIFTCSCQPVLFPTMQWNPRSLECGSFLFALPTCAWSKQTGFELRINVCVYFGSFCALSWCHSLYRRKLWNNKYGSRPLARVGCRCLRCEVLRVRSWAPSNTVPGVALARSAFYVLLICCKNIIGSA